MKLHARHTTTYLYSEPVSICHTEVHLAPRNERNQRVLEHRLAILPLPDRTFERRDYFGNEVTYFSIDEPHETLTVASDSVVELGESGPFDARLTPPWEAARDQARRHAVAETLDAYQFVFESPRITLGPEFAAYALPSFPKDRPLLEAARDLSHRIFADFEYDQRATTVTTPVTELLAARRGVCQDFAHFMISCLRSLGLSARYVSGYLRSGRLTGSEASHAWVSVFCPEAGWLDLDPTNDMVAGADHVTLAWGRDYSDVAPVKGTAWGGGEHVINVSVKVVPVGP